MSVWILYHPESPGVVLLVRSPSLLRRLRINRSKFATIAEARKSNTEILPMLDKQGNRAYILP